MELIYIVMIFIVAIAREASTPWYRDEWGTSFLIGLVWPLSLPVLIISKLFK